MEVFTPYNKSRVQKKTARAQLRRARSEKRKEKKYAARLTRKLRKNVDKAASAGQTSVFLAVRRCDVIVDDDHVSVLEEFAKSTGIETVAKQSIGHRVGMPNVCGGKRKCKHLDSNILGYWKLSWK